MLNSDKPSTPHRNTSRSLRECRTKASCPAVASGLSGPTQPQPKHTQSQYQGGRHGRCQNRGHLGIGSSEKSFPPHQPDANQDQDSQTQPVGTTQPVGQRQSRQERWHRPQVHDPPVPPVLSGAGQKPPDQCRLQPEGMFHYGFKGIRIGMQSVRTVPRSFREPGWFKPGLPRVGVCLPVTVRRSTAQVRLSRSGTISGASTRAIRGRKKNRTEGTAKRLSNFSASRSALSL